MTGIEHWRGAASKLGMATPMGMSPAEQLSAFENGSFRLEARLQGLSEKGIARLRAELAQLDADASDGVRKAVHHHYSDYIKACQVCIRFPCNSTSLPHSTWQVPLPNPPHLFFLLSPFCFPSLTAILTSSRPPPSRNHCTLAMVPYGNKDSLSQACQETWSLETPPGRRPLFQRLPMKRMSVPAQKFGNLDAAASMYVKVFQFLYPQCL